MLPTHVVDAEGGHDAIVLLPLRLALLPVLFLLTDELVYGGQPGLSHLAHVATTPAAPPPRNASARRPCPLFFFDLLELSEIQVFQDVHRGRVVEDVVVSVPVDEGGGGRGVQHRAAQPQARALLDMKVGALWDHGARIWKRRQM